MVFLLNDTLISKNKSSDIWFVDLMYYRLPTQPFTKKVKFCSVKNALRKFSLIKSQKIPNLTLMLKYPVGYTVPEIWTNNFNFA